MTALIDIAEDGVYCRAYGIGYHVDPIAVEPNIGWAWRVVKVRPVKGAEEQDIWEAAGPPVGMTAVGSERLLAGALDRCAALLMAHLREQGR